MCDISVIVPVYNMSVYIDRCIESVINQSYSDFRLIIIDDGSVDDSIDKCLDFARNDSRIVVVRKKNEGLGVTRNFGLRIVDTEYVTFLDADDWWHPDYLRYMTEGTQGGRNDIVLCDIGFVYQTPNGEYEKQISKLRFSAGALDLNKEQNLINKARTFMWGKVYRSKLFSKYGILQPPHAYEDVGTTPYLISKAKSVYYAPKELYFYMRNRTGSIVNIFSSLHGLIESLGELYRRFQHDCSLAENYSALRQLFWGQFCFICHRLETNFSDADKKEKAAIKESAIKLICECFPELENMTKYTFHVPSMNETILEALSRLVLNKENILKECDGADFIVDYFDNPDFYGKRILLKEQTNTATDTETVVWNLADEIFQSVWS